VREARSSPSLLLLGSLKAIQEFKTLGISMKMMNKGLEGAKEKPANPKKWVEEY